MLTMLKINLKNAETGKMTIADYVDNYIEGGKFFKYMGAAVEYAKKGKLD